MEQWTIVEEREKPDFLLHSPQGNPVGLEVTELLKESQGKLRSAERRVCGTIEDVVWAFSQSLGAPSVYITGNNKAIVPPHELRLDELRESLRHHLDQHGHGLGVPNGCMDVPFEHDWGTVTCIDRIETDTGVCFILDRPDHAPVYMSGRPVGEIEASLLACLNEKVTKATGYSEEWPIWLAIRNPNQRIGQVSASCSNDAQRINGTRFARVVLFNDPEDVDDPRPPHPHYVEIC